MRGLQDIQQCVATCLECGATCEETARSLVASDGERALVNALISCAAVSRLVADYLESGAELTVPTIDFFADVCRETGEACERVDDPQLGRCAQQCFECESCAREALAAD